MTLTLAVYLQRRDSGSKPPSCHRETEEELGQKVYDYENSQGVVAVSARIVEGHA